jgi:hypothetical protein
MSGSLSWEARFGTGETGEEAFQAWHYARFIEALVVAGKAQYDLPMYVNGAQRRPARHPGEYPSAGPLPHLMAIWKAGAPSLDFLAPDIYFPNFARLIELYAVPGNPLFVPEANGAGDAHAGANAVRTIGRHNAIGFSPFSIDTIDAAGAKEMTGLYGAFADLAPLILAAQAEGRIAGLAPPVTFEGNADLTPQTATFGGFRFTATFTDPYKGDATTGATHGAILLWLGGEDFVAAGNGTVITVEPVDGKGRLGFDTVDQARYVAGKWQLGRRLNGDQTHQGRHVGLPAGEWGIQKFRLYRY